MAQGGRADQKGLRIEPTVLVDVTEDDLVMKEEIFGPILPLLVYDDLDELIVRLQKKERPLALYLFTRSGETERKVLENLRFGGGCVNDTVVHLATSHMPALAEWAEAVAGRCHGKFGFDTFTHPKSVLKKGRWTCRCGMRPTTPGRSNC